MKNIVRISLLCIIFTALAVNAQLVSYLAFNGAYQSDPNGPDLFSDFVGDADGSLLNGSSYVLSTACSTQNWGYAASFDDIDDYGLISCPPPASLNFDRNDFTISGWVKVTSVGGEDFYHMVLENGIHNGGGVNVWVGPDNKSFRGKLGFEVKGDGADNISVLSDARIDDDQWHWFAGISKAQTLYLYVDGTLQSSTATYGAMTTATPPISHATVIGSKLGGLMDEFRIYDTALEGEAVGGVLTAGKLYELWQVSSSGIKAQWKFNEALNATSAADSVDELPAKLSNGASIVTGQAGVIAGAMGNAGSFDPINDAADWDNSIPNAVFLGNDNFTITGWFKIDDVLEANEPYYHMLFNSAIHGFGGVDVCVGPSDKSWRGKLLFNVKGTADNVDVSSNVRIDDGQWHWFACVSDSGSMSMYIDGIKQDDTDTYGATTTGNPPANFATSIGLMFSGEIDELTIHSSALTGELSDNQLTGGQLYDTWQITTSMTTCQQQQNAGFTLSADINNDCAVDFLDISLLADNWLKCYGVDSQDCINPFI